MDSKAAVPDTPRVLSGQQSPRTPARPAASGDLSPEVLAFAAEQGVRAYLPAVVEMARQLFPQSPLTVQVEDDPEIANDRHIVLIVANVGLEVSQAVEARWQWIRELFARSPVPLVCVFRLGMEGIR